MRGRRARPPAAAVQVPLQVVPKETLAGSQQSIVGQSRVGVGDVPLRGNMSPPVSDARAALYCGRPATHAIKLTIFSSARLRREYLRLIVADAQDLLVPLLEPACCVCEAQQ